MNENEQLIKKFYDCFGEKDWRGMLDCYHNEIISFYDPVFEKLEGDEVRAMWEMLLRNAPDLSVSVSDITSEDDYGSCHWEASYTFSATGRHILNKGKAHFEFGEGKITEHQDQWGFWNWSRQALGLSGLLLGGTSFLQNRVRRQAKQNLEKFMASRTSSGISASRTSSDTSASPDTSQ